MSQPGCDSSLPLPALNPFQFVLAESYNLMLYSLRASIKKKRLGLTQYDTWSCKNAEIYI